MSYKYATKSMVGKTYLTDIPFYNRSWGFRRNNNNYDRPDPLWFSTNGCLGMVDRSIRVKVDIDELIEQIILSPYTESYALSLVRDMVNQYGIEKHNGCEVLFPFRNMTIDHILPRSRGGSDAPDNLQLLCAACNSTKSNRTQEDLIGSLREQGVLR